MHFDDLNTQPGVRLALLTRGEADALIAVVGQAAEAQSDLRAAALELQATIGMRLPAG
ncbi:hypothetical protein OG239_01685 [Streptomyces sp. NBC_00868]|uniref:hypothetical protein n=1 Tax=Streptomyces sp. NBC_00868 TaxID=2903683 RepID=UPI0038666141|nr:hypothetical protein OG239_01685 [Streptomyces sp. NBC_00868]